jgi:hypothetical protein
VKLEGMPEAILDSSGSVGEGEAGRVSGSEPPMTSRQSEPRVDGAGTGVQCWPLRSGRRRPEASDRPRGHRLRGTWAGPPGRVWCIWNVGTPCWSGSMSDSVFRP